MTTSLSAHHHLLHFKKKTKNWQQAKEARHHLLHMKKKNKWRQVKEARYHLLHLEKKTNRWGRALWFVVIFYTWEKKLKNEQDWKRSKGKKKVDALVIFWRNVFCNITSAMSFATPFQHRFYSIVFCNITSTLPLQHCFL